MRRGIVWVETTLFRAVIIINIIVLIVRVMKILVVLLKLWLTWHRISIYYVAIDIHLYVLWIHALNISHHPRNIREKVWEIWNWSLCISSHAEIYSRLLPITTLRESLVITEVELEILMLLLLSISSLPWELSEICMLLLLSPESLLSLAYIIFIKNMDIPWGCCCWKNYSSSSSYS